MVTLGEGSEDGQVNADCRTQIESVLSLIAMAEMSSCVAEKCSFLLCPVDTRSLDVSTGGDNPLSS